MSVRRFVILYLGAVVVLAVAGAAAIRTVHERRAMVVAAPEPQPAPPAPSVAASPPQAAVAKLDLPALPPLRPPYPAAPQARSHAGKPRNGHPVSLSARTQQRRDTARHAGFGLPGLPPPGPGPYAAAWLPPAPARPAAGYPYPPPDAGYFARYPWPYYRPF
jgi:hypothetical protein